MPVDVGAARSRLVLLSFIRTPLRLLDYLSKPATGCAGLAAPLARVCRRACAARNPLLVTIANRAMGSAASAMREDGSGPLWQAALNVACRHLVRGFRQRYVGEWVECELTPALAKLSGVRCRERPGGERT